MRALYIIFVTPPHNALLIIKINFITLKTADHNFLLILHFYCIYTKQNQDKVIINKIIHIENSLTVVLETTVVKNFWTLLASLHKPYCSLAVAFVDFA